MTEAKDKSIQEYLESGYVEVQEFGEFKVGSRVRSKAQLWSEARTHGTGTVEHIFHKERSSWSQKYGKPDVELIIKRDESDIKPGGGPYMYLGDYHLALAEIQQ